MAPKQKRRPAKDKEKLSLPRQKIETIVEGQLQRAYQEMERQLQAKTVELIESKKTLQEEIQERKKVEKEVVELNQKEQRRFASQLHDGLCQDLTGILYFSKVLTQKMERERNLSVGGLKKISDMINEAVNQARETARGLYPGELEGTSLMRSLQDLASRTMSLLGVPCRFHCPESITIDDNSTATHLYRIAQEGINNSVRHGKAQNIRVSFTQKEDTITLTVEDDGKGFTHDPKTSTGIGLQIMKYRAHLMEASLQIEPALPRGVALRCTLKVPNRKSRFS